MEKYLPAGDKEQDAKLPGMGGVFNSLNLNTYHYSGLNPVIYKDPDGNNYVVAAAIIVGGAIGGYSAANEEGADPGSITRGILIGAAVGGISTAGAGMVPSMLIAGVATASGEYIKQGLNKGFDNVDGWKVLKEGAIGGFTAGLAKGLANKLIPNKNRPSVPESAAKVPEGRTQRMLAQSSSESVDKPVRDMTEVLTGGGIGTGTNTGTAITNNGGDSSSSGTYNERIVGEI